MEKGTIARLMDKGYGFIKTESSDKDLFFHSSELQGAEFNSLNEGDEVEFEITQGDKGPSATNVSPASGGGSSDNSSDDQPES